eukprot:scaffold19721_cov38-Cyclotella_meneghiniana.AAC.5
MNSKRNKPTTPTRTGLQREEPPEAKRTFQGGRDMDEDLGAWPTTAEAAAVENDERERRKKAREAKRAEISERAKAAKEAAAKAEGNDSSKTSLGAASERGRERSKSQSRSDKDKKKDKEKEKKNNAPSRGRSQSRGASRSARSSSVNTEKTDTTKRSRSMSVKSKSALKTGGKSAKKKRGKSLDTKKSSSGSESSGSKRKAPSSSEDDKGEGDGKTAKFAEGIPMNEGKTASTKKHAKAAKKGKSYSEKTKTPEKTTWPYRTYIFWTMKVGKVPNTCAEVYKRHTDAFRILQQCDPVCAIADHMNEKSKPLRSPGDFPKPAIGEHGRYQRYFTLDNEKDWSFNNEIKANAPRTFVGTFILLSDKDPHDLFNFCRVDLQNGVNGTYKVKPIQELRTMIGVIVLGVHANTWAESVAYHFRETLREAEGQLFEMRKEYYAGTRSTLDTACYSLEESWNHLDFPEISGIRSYPKRGPYEKSERGTDTSWKMAIHMEYPSADDCRIMTALSEAKRRGWIDDLFGKQSIVLPVVQDDNDVAGIDSFRSLLPGHQQTNRSVGNVVVPGILNMDLKVEMIFEPPEDGKPVNSKEMSIRDILRKVYLKMGSRKIQVFLYSFGTASGLQQLWFWNTVPEIKSFVENICRNLPGYLWHRCTQWGWEEAPLRKLFTASMDSETATRAMNSKWSEKNQRVIECAVGSDAANMLNFGTSPFILKEGETELASVRKQRAKITGSNIGVGMKGGICEDDDLASIGDESHAETVYRASSKYNVDEDDDISDYGDDEDEEEFPSSDDESTVYRGGGRSDGSDDDDDDTAFSTKAGRRERRTETSDVDDDDSAFSTKVGGRDRRAESGSDDSGGDDSAFSTKDGDRYRSRDSLDDLKRAGRKVHKDDEAEALAVQLAELEAKRQADLAEQVHQRQLEEERHKAEMEKMLKDFKECLRAAHEQVQSGATGQGTAPISQQTVESENGCGPGVSPNEAKTDEGEAEGSDTKDNEAKDSESKDESKEESAKEGTPPTEPVNLDNRPEAGDRGGDSRHPAGIG